MPERASCARSVAPSLLTLMSDQGGPSSSSSPNFGCGGYMRKNRSSMGLLLVIAFSLVFAVLLVLIPKTPVIAASPPLSGAIFTTDITGGVVNQNSYSAKCGPIGVYLDGGLGPSAPPTAAGLPDGDYYFQVTDPSGKTLLSTDAVQLRVLTVSGGLITSASIHPTFPNTGGSGGVTVELCPFNDTPNNGGVYKAWVTPVGQFLGDPTKVDNPCGNGCFHGFVPAFSKVDNFKVKGSAAVACMSVFKFIDANGNGIREPALGEIHYGPWGFRVIDPLGANISGTMFTVAHLKECLPSLFNLVPGKYTIIEDTTTPDGTGTYVVTANFVDDKSQNPVDTQITVTFKPNDLRHDVTFGNQRVGP